MWILIEKLIQIFFFSHKLTSLHLSSSHLEEIFLPYSEKKPVNYYRLGVRQPGLKQDLKNGEKIIVSVPKCSLYINTFLLIKHKNNMKS